MSSPFLPLPKTGSGSRARAAAPKGGGSGGGPFLSLKPVKGAAAKPSGGHTGHLGSFLHEFKKAIVQGGKDLETAAVSSPGGIYALGKAGAHDTAGALGHVPGASAYAKQRAHEPSQLAPIAKGIAKQTAADFEHPLRHPGNLGLDIAGVLSAGGGLVSRVGAAGRAASAAEEAGAAGRAAAAARALAKKPSYTRTILGQETAASANPVIRGVQKARDTRLERKAAAGDGPSYVKLAKRAAPVVERNVRLAQSVENAQHAGVIALSRGLSNAQLQAFRVVADGRPLHEVSHFHESRIVELKGDATPAARLEIERHRNVLKHLTQAGQQYVKTVDGKPVFRDGAKAKGGRTLAHVYDQAVKSAGSRDELLKSLNLITDEGIQARKAAPGRVIAGARFEPPTPAKLGVPNAGLTAARSRVASLERRFETAKAQRKTVSYPSLHQRGRTITREVPRTKAEAEARVDVLQKWVDERIAVIHREYRADPDLRSPSIGSDKRPRRKLSDTDKYRGVIGAGDYLEPPSKAIGKPARGTDRDWQKAEADIYRLGSKPGAHPVLKQIAERMDELDHLKQLLNDNAGAAIFGHEPPGFGTTKTTSTSEGRTVASDMPPKVISGGPRVTRLGGALSVAKDELERREAAAARKVKPTGLVGAEHVTNPHGLYISEAKRPSPTGRVALAVKGALGRPTVPPGLRKQPYTGASKIHALETGNPVRRIGEQGLEAQRLASGIHMRDILAQFGHKAPLPGTDLSDWRFLRTGGGELPAGIKSVIDKTDRGEPLKGADHGRIATAMQAFRDSVLVRPQELSPDEVAQLEEDAKAGKGVFVPKALTEQFERSYGTLKSAAGQKAVGAFDTINNANRAAILYLKVAYAVPNLLGNVAMNLVQQGFAAPANLARATFLAKRIPRDTWARIDTVMGQGAAESLAIDTGGLANPVHALAHVWGKAVDVGPRRAAFLYEARREGFRTQAQLEHLLSGKSPKLAVVEKRASDAIIDYGHLSPAEREIVRRVIFFYPWVKGSTRYAGHLATEHGVTAAATGQVGQVGAKQQASLGPLPSYLRGIFPTGGERDGLPLTVNPAAASILGTPADLASTIENMATGNLGGAFQGSAMLTPVMQALLTLATQKDDLGRNTTGSPLKAAGQGMYQGLPLYQLIQGMRGKLPPSRTYPGMTPRDYLNRYLIGGLAKRPTDPTALNRSAYLEKHPRR